MLSTNLKTLRKRTGLTQEEFASRLHVVRQTVSKWESGQSAPDAETLLHISEILEVPVADLLGDDLELSGSTDELRTVAEKLSVVTSQLADSAERRRRAIRALSVVALLLVLLFAVWAIMTVAALHSGSLPPVEESAIIGGADAPTDVYVTVRVFPVGLALIVLLFALGVVGLVLTTRK